MPLKLVALSLFLSLVIGCTCPCQRVNRIENRIPEVIVNQGIGYIVNISGEDFYNRFVSLNTQKSRFNGNFFELYFEMTPHLEGAEPYVIAMNVDTTGNLLPYQTPDGVPDCLKNPEKAIFKIDKEHAKQIALGNKLEKGVKDWLIEFSWEPKYNRYLWKITATFSETNNTNGTRADGKIMMIAPDTGQVLESNKWFTR